MEQLKNFKFFDLHEKLRLSDNDFDAWLEELGLLHGKRTCHKCGGRTTVMAVERKSFGDISNVFYNFWHHVSLFYPCERE